MDLSDLSKRKEYYDPPYESEIENEFARVLAKYINPSVDLIKQYRISTISGEFRADFCTVLESGFKIIFECDGKKFHDPEVDKWRDAAIFGEAAADVIIRINGANIYYNLDSILYVISLMYPSVFSDKGISILEQLAPDELTEQNIDFSREKIVAVWYSEFNDQDLREGYSEVKLVRYRRNVEFLPRTWLFECYEFSKFHPGRKPKELNDLFAKAVNDQLKQSRSW